MEGDLAKKVDMLNLKKWAVVGANDDPQKFGNKIYKKLKEKGYSVYPVNPNYEFIEGDKCYPDLSSLPEKPEVVEMVVSPKFGKNVLKEAAELGIENVWLQPGTCDTEMLDLLDVCGQTGIRGCVLVELC